MNIRASHAHATISPHPRLDSSLGWCAFVLLNLIILVPFFWPAICGKALLAPLDLAPNFFSKYQYIDSKATGIPANHYVIDLILGDVSRNLLVHESWARGEMPWWDPYTDGGKPLAAEANAVNISDPFKVVLFHLLPFEAAYNAIRIVPFLLSGIAAFLLLRCFRFGFMVATWGALLYEFAGCNFVMFSGPTVQASFVYYPLLWLLWHWAVTRQRLLWFGVSSIVTALIFLSGNLQSHSYVFLFTAAFFVGYGWKSRERWRLLVLGTGGALTVGLCLAAPFVLMQVEMFFSSARSVGGGHLSSLGSGIASISALYPWLLGTFRTLDLSKLFHQQSLGFWIYIGSPALFIAALGAATPSEPGSIERVIKRTSIALIAAYLLVCSTPLIFFLYPRTAWLAVLGLVILFAFGLQRLLETTLPLRRWAGVVAAVAGSAAAVANIGALVIYPRLQSTIEAKFLAAQRANPSLDAAEALRKFQVANLPNEVSFKNPETLAAFLGMIVLALFLAKPRSNRAAWLTAVLVLNFTPLLLFGHRYIPIHSMTMWEKLRAGGPEQNRVAEALRPNNLRLMEWAPGLHDQLFPGAMSQLHHVHVLHGHSSLFVKTGAALLKPPTYDYEYRSSERGLAAGELIRNDKVFLSRFNWSDNKSHNTKVESESLTRIMLSFDDADGTADFLRTDSFYPGWRAFTDTGELNIQFEPPCLSRVHVTAGTKRIWFTFEPRWWRPGLWLAGATATVLAAFLVLVPRKRIE